MRKFLHQFFINVALRCAHWASRLDKSNVDAGAAQKGASAPQLDLPPLFTGSAEEALLLWESPPVGLQKQKLIVKANSNGQIPEATEIVRLTKTGRLSIRASYILHDNYGFQGKPEEIQGRCCFCGRIGFRGLRPCAACGMATCKGCGTTLPDPNGLGVFLCTPHALEAEANRNIWAIAAPAAQSNLKDSAQKRPNLSAYDARSGADRFRGSPDLRGGAQ